MSAPLVKDLTSVHVYRESAVAPTKDFIATLSGSTQTTLTSTSFNGLDDEDIVFRVVEALDGNVKNQRVVVLDYDDASDTVTTTAFRVTPSNLTTVKVWDTKAEVAVPDGVGSTTECVASYRNEADDYWNGYSLNRLDGAGTGLAQISDFVNSTGTFTVSTAQSAAYTAGDAVIPVMPIQPSAVTYKVGGGDAIEREIVTDTLAQEGIIVGAITDDSMEMDIEIRGSGSAPGTGVAATKPAEAKALLDPIFDDNVGTSGDVGLTVTDKDNFTYDNLSVAQYDMVLVNGEVTGLTAVSGGNLTTAGHLTTAPSTDDVIYAGTTYKPKDTGHESVGFMCFKGDGELVVAPGCMPSLGIDLSASAIAKYKFSYKGVGGLWAPFTKVHDDIYDTTKPTVVKSNITRFVIDGVELEADVLNISGELLPEPNVKGASFNAFENNGGHFYTMRQPQITARLYFEDSSYIHRFRSMVESDLLIQVGCVAGDTWALWAPRAQIVAAPEVGDENELMAQDITFRLLRPSTAGQPDFIITHF